MKEKEKKQIIIIIILVCLLLGAVAYIVLSVFNSGKGSPTTGQESISEDTGAVEYDGIHQTPLLQNGQAGIAIPGFKSLVFVADQTTQAVNFYNPDVNDCYFIMTLLIDGQDYWHSGNVAPGKCYYSIDLSKPISKGEFSGVLHIDCVKDDGSQLNSADIEFTLEVV